MKHESSFFSNTITNKPSSFGKRAFFLPPHHRNFCTDFAISDPLELKIVKDSLTGLSQIESFATEVKSLSGIQSRQKSSPLASFCHFLAPMVL